MYVRSSLRCYPTCQHVEVLTIFKSKNSIGLLTTRLPVPAAVLAPPLYLTSRLPDFPLVPQGTFVHNFTNKQSAVAEGSNFYKTICISPVREKREPRIVEKLQQKCVITLTIYICINSQKIKLKIRNLVKISKELAVKTSCVIDLQR